MLEQREKREEGGGKGKEDEKVREAHGRKEENQERKVGEKSGQAEADRVS